ncbi:MAG: hypothetical protein U9P50_03395 [Patescibacteria group bacterium]|nr:hypothetical protein [Patescibacteria group bacterium]
MKKNKIFKFIKILVNILKNILLIFLLILVVIFLNRFAGTGVNHLDFEICDLEFERILFVPGISTPKFYLFRWKKDLDFNFPDKEIVFLDDSMYIYWQDDKTEEIVGKGVIILNDNKPTFVIAHSYGGVLAKTMIDRAENANIAKFITMASPHQMNGFGIDESKDFLETPEDVSVPTFSFGGYIDPIVLFPLSDVGTSSHQDIWSGHSGFLFNKNVRKQVLEYAFGIKEIEEVEKID